MIDLNPTLLVGIGGLILAVLTYFAGVQRGKRYRDDDRKVREAAERRSRIQSVVQGYIALACSHPRIDTGVPALITAGVRGLRDDSEIREALEIIRDRTGSNPLGRQETELRNADLKVFFEGLGSGR